MSLQDLLIVGEEFLVDLIIYRVIQEESALLWEMIV